MSSSVENWKVELIEAHRDLFAPPCDAALAAQGAPECGPGWHDLLDRMCVRNPDRGPGRRRTFKFSQIKEKYGTLRVYWDGSLSSEATIQVEEAIALAEARSATCCEICEIYRYDVLGEAAPKRVVFGNVPQPDSNPDFKGPDGMAFGTDGRLYCAVYNQKNVTVLDRPRRGRRSSGPGRTPADELCLCAGRQEAARH
ncbi:hypothetical protein CI1B_31160 [Bradyrhizobium ivorense]|uniref:SMP-30/Gluconolactonase/LRE-like region domain-containing protein n=2 Tax=Bradyrhizobium ivorense TaxID=2511166 RepID=A0A508T505_9BRAD|nr:hypothetical protein CI1B_31160 [Bradyrhizobium ivorense]